MRRAFGFGGCRLSFTVYIVIVTEQWEISCVLAGCGGHRIYVGISYLHLTASKPIVAGLDRFKVYYLRLIDKRWRRLLLLLGDGQIDAIEKKKTNRSC